MPYNRKADGEVLSANDINTMQVGLETVETNKLNKGKLSFTEVTVGEAMGTVAKTATVPGYTPSTGDILRVTFTNGNNANAPTLSINGGAAIPFRIGTSSSSATSMTLGAGYAAMVYYDGVALQQFGAIRAVDADTTYFQLSQVQAEDSASTTVGLATGQRLYQAIVAHAVRPTATQTLTNKTLTDPVVSGRLYLSTANDGIELGPLATVNTPYIDFHSSGLSTDYDSRIIASGGTTTIGTGRLQLEAGETQLTGKLLMPMTHAGIELGNPGADNSPYIDFRTNPANSDAGARIQAWGGDATFGNGTLDVTANNFRWNAGTISRFSDGNHVPSGGSTRMALFKNSDAWYDTGWRWIDTFVHLIESDSYVTNTSTANWVLHSSYTMSKSVDQYDFHLDVSALMSRSVASGGLSLAVQLVDTYGNQILWKESLLHTNHGVNVSVVQAHRVVAFLNNHYISQAGNVYVNVYYRGTDTAGTTGIRHIRGFMNVYTS